MKRILFIVIATTCVLFAHAQHNCTVITSTKNTVTFRVIGYGKKSQAALNDAELSAVKTLLYQGAEGTNFRIPLISGTQDVIESKNQSFFNNFYGHSYADYVESSVIVVPFGKDATKQRCLTADICVKAWQLRSYLENSGIIRKFGL